MSQPTVLDEMVAAIDDQLERFARLSRVAADLAGECEAALYELRRLRLTLRPHEKPPTPGARPPAGPITRRQPGPSASSRSLVLQDLLRANAKLPGQPSMDFTEMTAALAARGVPGTRDQARSAVNNLRRHGIAEQVTVGRWRLKR